MQCKPWDELTCGIEISTYTFTQHTQAAGSVHSSANVVYGDLPQISV